MERWLEFNGVKVLLTTGEHESEVQSFFEEAYVVISVYPDRVKVLKGPGVEAGHP